MRYSSYFRIWREVRKDFDLIPQLSTTAVSNTVVTNHTWL